jgi:hypothetical protein
MASVNRPAQPSLADAAAHGAPTTASGPRVLLVHYTYTQQALRMSDAMAEAMRERGCHVTQAAIEFTDLRYVDRVTRFPMKHAFLDVLRMMPAQVRRKTGEIRVPPEAQGGDYDLVCVFSPTWWLTTCMPIRSFLKAPTTGALLAGTPFTDVVVCRRYWGNNHKTVRKLGVEHGGEYVEGIHFKYAGGQVRSLLSLISYLGSGEYRERFLGVRIPRTNLSDAQVDEGRAFARALAARGQTTAPAAGKD